MGPHLNGKRDLRIQKDSVLGIQYYCVQEVNKPVSTLLGVELRPQLHRTLPSQFPSVQLCCTLPSQFAAVQFY